MEKNPVAYVFKLLLLFGAVGLLVPLAIIATGSSSMWVQLLIAIVVSTALFLFFGVRAEQTATILTVAAIGTAIQEPFSRFTWGVWGLLNNSVFEKNGDIVALGLTFVVFVVAFLVLRFATEKR